MLYAILGHQQNVAGPTYFSALWIRLLKITQMEQMRYIWPPLAGLKFHLISTFLLYLNLHIEHFVPTL